MPGRDRTGPLGFGAMTGRGFGYCAGFNLPGYAMGRGYGFGFRRFNRFGFPHRFGFYGSFFAPGAYPAVTVNEKEILKDEASLLENQLKLIKKRLEEMEEETE